MTTDNPFPPGTPTDVARRTTLSELCRAWNTAEREIAAAFKLIERAEGRLESVFQGGNHCFSVQKHGQSVNWSKPQEATERLRRQVWRVIAERMALRQNMSLAQAKELDRQIETGEGLPPIRYTDVLATVETLLSRRGEFLEAKVHECYRWLRPDCWSGSGRYGYTPLATNRKSFEAGVGEKVIISYGCQRCFRGGFEVNYNRRDELRALDQVFHLLDGQPQVTTHGGELCDAIYTQTKTGGRDAETPYFHARCYGNQNLHLTFKRRDLLDKFNLIAGGKNLGPGKQNT